MESGADALVAADPGIAGRCVGGAKCLLRKDFDSQGENSKLALWQLGISAVNQRERNRARACCAGIARRAVSAFDAH